MTSMERCLIHDDQNSGIVNYALGYELLSKLFINTRVKLEIQRGRPKLNINLLQSLKKDPF